MERYRAGGTGKPSVSVTIAPEDGDAEVLGKLVSALHDGITVNDTGVYGALNHVTGYTGFSGNAAEQSGHYLVLRVETEDSDDTITVELVGGTLGHPVTLDEDRNIVLRITNPRKQKIRIVASHVEDGTTLTTTKTLRLNDLVLKD